MGMDSNRRAARVAILVKQIPATDSLKLDPNGKLVRSGLALEMNPYCRRAVSLGIALAKELQGKCTVFTLAPVSGEDVLREAVAAGANSGILISDQAFSGSDTLATARALVAALKKEGPFDLIVCGRNSVDADTGQIGPQVAELLNLPFVASAKEVQLRRGCLYAKSERDDGWAMVRVDLPAVLSAAERSCAPARADAAARAAVSPDCIFRLTAHDLGPGPWGQAGSPTKVGEVRPLAKTRHQTLLTGPMRQQAADAVRLLFTYGAFASTPNEPLLALPGSVDRRPDAPEVAVILEPRRGRLARELCTAGAVLAAQLNGTTIGFVTEGANDWPVGSWGLDHIVVITGAKVEEDVAQAVVQWIIDHEPSVVLTSGTVWGREVAARVAASLNLGLIGDAVELGVSQSRVVAWKPALGGRLLAQITTDSDPQMITLRMGTVPAYLPRPCHAKFTAIRVKARNRVRIIKSSYDDDADVLFSARSVVGVGMGVSYNEYHLLAPLIEALEAPLACSRKVADRGWLPRTRQVGLTGHHIAPQLYVAIGLRGALNHTVGTRRSKVILAINSDRDAAIFTDADIGITGDWREVVPHLAHQIELRTLKKKISSNSSNHNMNQSAKAHELRHVR